MSLEKKLLSKIISEQEIEEIFEERETSLRRYIKMIGLNWKNLSQEQIDKISDSQAYKQYKALRSIKYKQQQAGIKEDIPSIAPKKYEPSKRYKYSDPTHVARQAYYAGLINKGYSVMKTPPLYKSIGPKGYKARPVGKITFGKLGVSASGQPKTVDTITRRELKKKKEYTGKTAKYEEFNGLQEADSIKKKAIPKMTNMKEVKPEDEKQCEKQYEITKTLTGEKQETNTIQINPNMKIIRKSDKDKEDKKEKKND
jgi:hypothetical protein